MSHKHTPPPETAVSKFWQIVNGKGTDMIDAMTLRDYFAAKALQGLLACPMEGSELPACVGDVAEAGGDVMAAWREHFSELSYQYADAMIAARNVQAEGSP